MKEKLKIGSYEPVKVKKGYNETVLPLKEGDIFWLIRTEDGGFDTLRQEDAEIISRLIRVEQLLKRLMREEKK